VLTVILAVMFLGERVATLQIAGITLALIGGVLLSRE